MTLSYSSFGNEHFKTPRMIIESAYPSDSALKTGLIGSGTDSWKYAVIFAPEDISSIGWRMSELSKEQMNRIRDHIHALYDLHRTHFTDAVFAYAKTFRDAEHVNATGSIDPNLNQ